MTSAPVSSPSLRRYRAERLLRRDFAGLRSQVLAIVRARLRSHGVTLDASDLEACYATAWQGLYTTVLDGEQVENHAAWLVLVTFRRAIDESRAASSRRLAGEISHTAFVDPDLAGTLDDRARLQQVLEALRSGLTARECEAASLCYLQGLSRSDAAARMGLSESRMRKLMDGSGAHKPGLAGKFGALLDTIGAGGWCEQQSSLLRAYAFGILDPEGPRHALAALHCRECPACRAHVAALRGLAAVLPPLPLRLALAGGAGGGAAGSAAVRSSATGSPVAGSPAAGSSAAGSSGGALGAGGAATGSAGMAAGAAGVSTGASWTAGAGPLAVKLAVVGAMALGAGGYVALAGATRHASPSHAPVAGSERAAPSSAYPKLYEADFASLPKSVPARQPVQQHPSRIQKYLQRQRPTRSAHASANDAAAHEFGPEHVSSAASRAAPDSSRGTRSATRSSREFGFE